MLMGQPRIFFSMSRDRLLPEGVSKVHPRFGTPYITTIITGVIVAVFAGITPINVVGEMTSIGTLFAFVVVCAAVIMLRIKRPEAHRPFKVPFGYLFPVLGVVSCLYLMLSLTAAHLGALPRLARPRDDDLLVLRADPQPAGRPGGAGRAERRRADRELRDHARRARPLQRLLHDGARLMTELGITTEAPTKWHEIHVTPHQADTVGLAVLGVGAVLFFAGRVLAKSGRPAAA